MISDKSAVSLVFLSCLIGTSVFYIKYMAMSLSDDIKATKAELVKSKKYNKILHAEWQALTNPDRIQKLADMHLGKNFEPASVIDAPIDGYCSAYDEKKVDQLLELINDNGKEQ